MRRLASFVVTAYTVIGLVVWLFWGRYLGDVEPYRSAVKAMNSRIIVDWFFGPAWNQPLVAIWFAGLCLLCLVLFINLACCLWVRMPFNRLGKMTGKRAALLVVHLLLALVMAAHAVSLVVGDKHEDLKVVQGQVVKLQDGYVLKVKEIEFKDDLKLLRLEKRQARHAMNSDNFHRESNLVKVSLLRNSEIMEQGDLCILSPLSLGKWDLVVTKFNLKQKNGREILSANITITSGSQALIFFFLYVFFILSLIWLLVASWQNGANSGLHKDAISSL
ncbi:hypothetical protein [Dethiosulfatarculus sandiegensis]|uniref:ResB-like domain-containing protein n=1 Tax=Dethiosulfatarculus sandiegensis TaxID=1429043 RepID=A0A0D2I0N3_9BACT|nr:hypothetical protein [Dethiosulfatarculus sandiegensis]KIX16013.1 hypothetical protein X474_00150 [Dethiosulfatarculus sandiegensis]